MSADPQKFQVMHKRYSRIKFITITASLLYGGMYLIGRVFKRVDIQKEASVILYYASSAMNILVDPFIFYIMISTLRYLFKKYETTTKMTPKQRSTFKRICMLIYTLVILEIIWCIARVYYRIYQAEYKLAGINLLVNTVRT